MKRLLYTALYTLRNVLTPFFNFEEIAILAYHSISNDPAENSILPDVLERQLTMLRAQGSTFVTLKEIVEWHAGRGVLPKKAIAVTFDDGYTDFRDVALPILQRMHIPVTLFFLADASAHAEKLSSHLPMLTLEEVLALAALQGVELGYHTRSHPDLPALIEAQLYEECAPPVPLEYFAYPGGRYTHAVFPVLKKVGYVAAFSIKPELVQKKQDRYLLPRIVVTRHMSFADLRMRVSRASSWYRSIRRVVRYG